MDYAPLLKKTIARMVFRFLFLFTLFFLISCNSKKPQNFSACLTAEEKADLEYLFRLLIFENYGAFVLFGTKPICEMHLIDSECTAADVAFQEWFDSLPNEKRAEFKARMINKTQKEPELERNPYRGWLAWEKVRKTFKMKHYILRIAPLRGPGRYELMFVNIKQTSLVMAKNYTTFKKAAGREFHPLQIVVELQNPNSVFWNTIFCAPNHLAKGLLFGFGLTNSLFGDLQLTYSNPKFSSKLKKYTLKKPSANRVKYRRGSELNLTIPLFRAIKGDPTAENYTKEKIEIEKIYHGQDLVEVTLQHLAS